MPQDIGPAAGAGVAAARAVGIEQDFGLVVGHVSDSEPFSGTQPITFADRVRAMDTIRLVGTDDPSPKVRKFAMLAARKLGFSSGPAR